MTGEELIAAYDEAKAKGLDAIGVLLHVVNKAELAEREACAKVCDAQADEWATGCQGWAGAVECAEAIRARGRA